MSARRRRAVRYRGSNCPQCSSPEGPADKRSGPAPMPREAPPNEVGADGVGSSGHRENGNRLPTTRDKLDLPRMRADVVDGNRLPWQELCKSRARDQHIAWTPERQQGQRDGLHKLCARQPTISPRCGAPIRRWCGMWPRGEASCTKSGGPRRRPELPDRGVSVSLAFAV